MGVVLLVRHGQASFGTDDYDVLSNVGWDQSRLLGRYLAERGVVPDVLLRGDMRRHRETAEGLVEGAAWSVKVTPDPGWNEFDHLGVVAAYPEFSTTGELDRRGFQRLFELATQRWTTGGRMPTMGSRGRRSWCGYGLRSTGPAPQPDRAAPWSW